MLEGEYVPSPWEVIATQVADYERTGGEEGGEIEGAPCVIVTSVGAKSGVLRKTPLIRVTDGVSWAAFGSMGGAPNNPQWVHNLRANPVADVQDGPDVTHCTARELSGEEKQEWWARGLEVWPSYDEYQEATDRVIPVFVLEPASHDEA